MRDLLKLEIEVICMVHIVAIILSLTFFMVFYIRARKDTALKAFLMMQISMIGWMVFKIFKTVSPEITLRWWFIVAYYICAIVLEIAFLEFGYAYHKGHGLSNKIRAIIYILPIIQIAAIITNPRHYLFYATYDFWDDSFGPLFYIHTGIEYIYIAIGFYYCSKTFKERLKGEKNWHKWLISTAIIAPIVLNFLYITKVVNKWVAFLGIPVVFDITPIVFIWSTSVFMYATFKHDFIGRSPIMQHEVVHRLDTPISVHNENGQMIYLNEKLEALLGKQGKEVLNERLDKFFLNEISDKECELILGDLTCLVYVKPIKSFRNSVYLITYKDITPYRLIESEIKSNQEALEASNVALEEAIEMIKEDSKAGARTYVARELHDIIGHSLVVTIKLLEVAKLYFNRNRQLSLMAVSDASDSIGQGIKEMTIMSQSPNSRKHYSGYMLQKDLEKSLKQFKLTSIKTTLHFKGGHFNIDSQVYNTIKKVATELMTNVLKHSQGSELLILVHLSEDSLLLKVVDNGIGSDTLVAGNGLKGIEERIRLINGSVHFSTAKNEGLMATIKVNK